MSDINFEMNELSELADQVDSMFYSQTKEVQLATFYIGPTFIPVYLARFPNSPRKYSIEVQEVDGTLYQLEFAGPTNPLLTCMYGTMSLGNDSIAVLEAHHRVFKRILEKDQKDGAIYLDVRGREKRIAEGLICLQPKTVDYFRKRISSTFGFSYQVNAIGKEGLVINNLLEALEVNPSTGNIYETDIIKAHIFGSNSNPYFSTTYTKKDGSMLVVGQALEIVPQLMIELTSRLGLYLV